MGLLQKLIGGSRTPSARQTPVAQPPKRRPNPTAAGDMLIYHLLIADGKQFCVPAAEYDRLEFELPEHIRNNFKTWATLYLGWRLRVCARQEYGPEFQDAMTGCAYAKLETSGIPEVDIPIREMRIAFRLLDGVHDLYVKDGAPVYNGIELPFAYLAACQLLISTQGLSSDAEHVQGELELATALATLEEQTADILLGLLKASAEGAYP